jgi:outer membrane protein assembly factor BamB
MRTKYVASATLLLLSLLLFPLSLRAANWPAWRGPFGTGICDEKNLPVQWSTTNNVKWRVPLAERGNSTPIVWGDRIFVTQPAGDRRTLICFNRTDGRLLWNTGVTSAEAEPTHPTNPFCSASPATDGERVIVSFASDGLYCYDFTGKEIWRRTDLGRQIHIWGNGASPVIHGDLCFLNFGPGETTYLLAVNKKTGKLVWEDNSVEDRILHGQWSTPSVGTIGGVAQVVSAQGDGWVRGYEAASGKKLWEFDTNPKDAQWPRTRNEIIATPVIVGDRVYIGNGQDPEHGEGVGHFYAIDATKRGDITTTGRLWHYDKIRRSISTAAVADGLVYIADFSGFLHCLDANTGQPYWTHDVFAAVWGSPMVVDGKVYLGDEDGDVVVMQHGKEKKQLAEMNMGSAVYATAVPAHGALFMNNRNQLFALSLK